MNRKRFVFLFKFIAVFTAVCTLYGCAEVTDFSSETPSSSAAASSTESLLSSWPAESGSSSGGEISSFLEGSASRPEVSSSQAPEVSSALPEKEEQSSSQVVESTVSSPPASSTQPLISSVPPASSAVSVSTPASTSGNGSGGSESIREPVASGTTVYAKDGSTIDASNISEGYVMVSQTGITSRLKVQVITSQKTYNYDLNGSGNMEVYPLQMGDGKYTVRIMRNVTGNSYTPVYSVDLDVKLSSPTVCFLYPSQYVNYNSSSDAVVKSFELCADASTELDKIKAVYEYVIGNISYDTDKAAGVASLTGYLPEVDDTLATGKGICFDYAVLFAAMLRVQNIPTRVVIGSVSSSDYTHAWNQVYITGVGWVTAGIYFDGKSWVRMDPTFAASGGSKIESFIGDGSNYTATRIY